MRADAIRRCATRLAAFLAALGVCSCASTTQESSTVRTSLHAAPPTPEPDRADAVLVRRFQVGTSVLGRPITAVVVGARDSTVNILVVGCVHGNEPAGEAVTRSLRTATPPPGVKWWLVDEFNPDGCTAGTRVNADGVDLNRNSTWHWRSLFTKGSIYWSGPRPLSEPESRAIHRLVLRIRPAVSIWYHQHAALVDTSSGGGLALESVYSRISRLHVFNYGVYPGSITTWQDAMFPTDTAFVVELPPGPLPPDSIRRHVQAVEAVSRLALSRPR